MSLEGPGMGPFALARGLMPHCAKLPWQRKSTRKISTGNVVLITKQQHSSMAFLTFLQNTFRDNL
jgi:hypothetical protein